MVAKSNKIVHDRSKHRWAVMVIGEKWLWCAVCGSLKPSSPLVPWLQPSDQDVIREYVLRSWGLDPYLLTRNQRKERIKKRIEGARVAPIPGVPQDSIEGLTRLLKKLRSRYSLPKLSDRRRSWGYKAKMKEGEGDDAPADESVQVLREADRVERGDAGERGPGPPAP